MNTALESIQKVVLFLIVMILINDIGGAIYLKQQYQGGIDFCVKSASMEIVRDSDYAKGMIKIDKERSIDEFKNMMRIQFNLSLHKVEEGIVFAEPVNTVPYIFLHPITRKQYIIKKPMFIVIFRIKRKGIFLNNSIIIDNLSGSQVDLKR